METPSIREAKKRWYVIHSKPRCELIAQAHLDRQGFRTYFPRALQPTRIHGRWIDRVAPLFPRYLFLHADVERQSLAPVRSTIGVSALVRFGNRSAIVPDGLVENLMTRAERETGLHRLQKPGFICGESVWVSDGPFTGLEGVFECYEGERRVLILLEVLGSNTPVRMSVDQVSPLFTR